MTDTKFVEFVTLMQAVLEGINALKQDPQFDGRSLSVAATHHETAMLWVANARREVLA